MTVFLKKFIRTIHKKSAKNAFEDEVGVRVRCHKLKTLNYQDFLIKGALSDLKQFLAFESPLKE